MSGTANVNINVGGPTGPIVVKRQSGCLMQILYFCFIGFWLGALAACLAYFLLLLVITIPLGVRIINHIPYLMAHRQPPLVLTPWGQEVKAQQHSLLIRALWFPIGMIVTAIWMCIAYVLCCTLILMPVGFWMFDRAPALLTLHNSR